MEDPDLAWTVAAYLANGGTVPGDAAGTGIDVVDHLGNVFNLRGSESAVIPGQRRDPARPSRPASDLSRMLRALGDAVTDVSFSVRDVTFPDPVGDVELIEPDEAGLPAIAVGAGVWLLDGDEARPVEDDGDVALAVATEYAESVHARRRSFGM